jgi:hypothetical protein
MRAINSNNGVPLLGRLTQEVVYSSADAPALVVKTPVRFSDARRFALSPKNASI